VSKSLHPYRVSIRKCCQHLRLHIRANNNAQKRNDPPCTKITAKACLWPTHRHGDTSRPLTIGGHTGRKVVMFPRYNMQGTNEVHIRLLFPCNSPPGMSTRALQSTLGLAYQRTSDSTHRQVEARSVQLATGRSLPTANVVHAVRKRCTRVPPLHQCETECIKTSYRQVLGNAASSG